MDISLAIAMFLIGVSSIITSVVTGSPPLLFLGCCWISAGISAIPVRKRRR